MAGPYHLRPVLAVLGYLLIALVAFALPGWLLARALRPDDLGLERLLVTMEDVLFQQTERDPIAPDMLEE